MASLQDRVVSEWLTELRGKKKKHILTDQNTAYSGFKLVRSVYGHWCIELSECVDAHCNCNGLWEDLSVWYKEVYLRERLGKHHGTLTVSFICHTQSLMGYWNLQEFDLKCFFYFNEILS